MAAEQTGTDDGTEADMTDISQRVCIHVCTTGRNVLLSFYVWLHKSCADWLYQWKRLVCGYRKKVFQSVVSVCLFV